MSIQFQQVVEFIAASPYFSNLGEEERQKLAREFDVVSLPEGQYLFHQGAGADAFYFILDGRLMATREKTKRVVSEYVLQRGDAAGEEAFKPVDCYRESVHAVTDAILLRIPGERLAGLIDQHPRLVGFRNLLVKTNHLNKLVNLDWLNRDERVILINRKNGFFLISRILIPCLVGLAGMITLIMNLQSISRMPQPIAVAVAIIVAAMLIWIFWIILDWSNDYSILTSKRLVQVDRAIGLFDRRDEIPLGNIMSVDIETTPLGKIFAFANVTSRTYNVPVVWQGISNPDLVAGFIQAWAEKAKSTSAEIEMSAMQAALDRQLGSPVGESNSQAGSEQVIPTGMIGQTMIYRKHWVVLFRKTWLPFILGNIGVFVMVGGFSNWMPVLLSESARWLIGSIVVIFLFWYLYQFLDWSNDIYQVSAEQVIDLKRTPLGREDRKTAPLENILSINYRKRGLMGLLLNYGTVNIQVGTESLIFDYVRDPSGVQREIFRRIAERQAAIRQTNLEAERDRMSQWIAAYHRRVNE